MTTELLEITSDEDAWKFLEHYMGGNIDPDSVELNFDGWPRVHVYLKGEKFHHSLTPEVMSGFIALQKSINQTYSLLKYGETNKRLSSEEKSDLQIVVSVEDGSSDTEAILEGALKIISQAVTGMESEHKLLALVAAGLLLAGTITMKQFLNYRARSREQDLEAQNNAEQKEVRLRELDNMQFMSEQETKRMEIMTAAMSKAPILEPVQQAAETAHGEVLKSVASADKVELQGVELSSGQIDELKTNIRKQAENDTLVGEFLVEGVITKDPEKYKVHLKRLSDSLQVRADIPMDEDSVSEGIRNVIQTAEWSDEMIYCSLTIKKIGDEIRAAKVAIAREVTE